MSSNSPPQSSNSVIERHIENLESPNPRIRSQSAEDLGKLGAQEAVPDLVERLQEDVNTYVRSATAEALGRIGDATAIFPLIDALRDSCSFVRRASAISLGQMQAKEAQAALVRTLEDPNFYVRRASINAIGKLGIPDLGAKLIPFLDTPDPRIRRTTIIALRRLGNADAVDQMIDMLDQYLIEPNQRDLPVVKTLVVALGEMESKEAVPILVRVLRGYVGVRSLTAKALGRIGDTRAAEALVEALQDVKSRNLQLAALKSLGELGYRAAAPSILEFLDDPDPRLRRTAALALGLLGDDEAISKLLAMASNDESPLVRPSAVEALGQIGDASLVPQLLAFVDDSNAYLRAALAHALSSLDGDTPEVQSALHKLQQDKVRHVAIAADRALANCSSGLDLAQEEVASEVDGESCPAPDKKHVSWLRRFLGRG